MFKIYEVYSIVHESGKHYKKNLGRVLFTPTKVVVLEDHYRFLVGMFPETISVSEGEHIISRLNHNPYFFIRQQSDAVNYDNIKELSNQEEPVQREHVWLYSDPVNGEHHKLHFDNIGFYLNDQPLADDELARLLDDIHSGGITLTYPDQQVMKNLKQIEDKFVPVTKFDGEASFYSAEPKEGEPSVEEVIKHLDLLAKNGKIPDSMTKVLRKHVFEHPMAPGVGNRYAWEQHKKRTQGLGNYYIVGDVNSFKNINDSLGHEIGDQTICLLGRLIRETADEIGSENIKTFMPAGDEFIFAASNPEVAFVALRKIVEKLKAIPNIGGIHQLSAAMGIGMSFVMADRAMNEAKKAKYHPMGMVVNMENKIDHYKSDRLFEDHTTPNFAYNLLPGQEGFISL